MKFSEDKYTFYRKIFEEYNKILMLFLLNSNYESKIVPKIFEFCNLYENVFKKIEVVNKVKKNFFWHAN